MLRHIKDIKSPIQVATAKHAARKEKKGKDLGGHTRTAKIAKESGEEVSTPTVATLAEKEEKKDESAVQEGPHPIPLPSPGSRQIKGYCISIYPYLAEREVRRNSAVALCWLIGTSSRMSLMLLLAILS